MTAPNVSIAMKLGYQHAVLTEEGDVLAECGVWHKHEDDECEVAENWVLVRKTGECGHTWGFPRTHMSHRCTLIGEHRYHICVVCGSSPGERTSS